MRAYSLPLSLSPARPRRWLRLKADRQRTRGAAAAAAAGGWVQVRPCIRMPRSESLPALTGLGWQERDERGQVLVQRVTDDGLIT